MNGGRRPQMPTPPAAPRKNVGAPFRGGDRVLDRREMVASTNQIPGVKHEGEARHYSRGISLREDRDHWQSGRDYGKMAQGMIDRGRMEHKTVEAPRPARRVVSRRRR